MISQSILFPASGRIGGVIASRNKGGAYFRLGTNPTNPNSARQQAVRSIMGTQASAWQNVLSDAERAQWAIYAETHPVINRLGASVFINALAWFTKCNCPLSDAGLTLVTVPPATAAPNSPTTITATLTAPTTLSLAFTGSCPSGAAMQVWATLPGPPGSSPNKAQARLVGYSAADCTTPVALTMPWTFQAAQVTQIYAGFLDPQGLISAFVHDEAVAVAP